LPEGDTIFKTAAALRPLLVGQQILTARASRPGPAIERVIGSHVTVVEPVGKHMLIRFDNGLALHTHLRMGGSWHRYAPGESWRRPAWQARVVLEVPGHVIVCFGAPVVELMPDRALALHGGLQRLGPDLLSDSFDAEASLQRLRRHAHAEIAEALLDQTNLAGIGNVFKSEILFIERINPWTHVSTLDDEALRRLISTAEMLLRQNVSPGRPHRITTRVDSAGRDSVWVYSRMNRSCLRCGTPIRSQRQGRLSRLTYWCPTCQPPVR
jgi:endonuclease VIII